MTLSTRAQVITRRTYNRPLDDEGTTFETWEQTVERVVGHQRWLWERAQGRSLSPIQEHELEQLSTLLTGRYLSVSGRTLWLGGTEIAKTREASQFNCSFGKQTTVHDVVDAYWLLLQGCGVGFEPVAGTLNGFAKRLSVSVIRSERSDRGTENNLETFDKGVWTIRFGDSGKAWAKAAGKLLAFKGRADKLVLDFSEVRKAGHRLRGYGWISSGDERVAAAFTKIAELLNDRAGQLLSRIDILDILNLLGTTLSSRRSAEIAVMPWTDDEAEAFALAKKDHFSNGKDHRSQSNNSLMFYKRPTKGELGTIFDWMADAGGSEPGFINAEAAKRRAPWFKGVNPCAEILLGDKSFCNLVEVDLGKFNGDWEGLLNAYRIAARANYRQTCVNLDDGVLQRTWHELNEFLRLCGVGATGIVRWQFAKSASHWRRLRFWAQFHADIMADELGTPRSKAVTTVKPSGTLSKIMDTTEGVHRPLGRYIFNNVQFSEHDPLIPKLRAAGYRIFPNPYDPTTVLVTFPVSYEDVEFTKVGDVEVNQETAVEQLERYKLLMDNYVDHNCSITVSYSPDEVPAIIDWIWENWDSYVGVSFLYRNDPTKRAEDLGYPYLPQEVVTEAEFYRYFDTLSPVSLQDANSLDMVDDGGCSTGACPIR